MRHKSRNKRHRKRLRKEQGVMQARVSVSAQDLRPVSFVQTQGFKCPDLWFSVWIEAEPEERQLFAEMFVKAQCRKAATPLEADLVVFGGGVDVNPELYNETRHARTSYDSQRDKADIALYKLCYDNGIPMLGICRGAQFIHVMKGGKLFQHVDGHFGDHFMWDVHNRKLIDRVSSVHHQMVIPNPKTGIKVLATSTGKSKERWFNEKTKDTESFSNQDVEAFFYRDICALGIQGHPEYRGYEEFQQWTLEAINSFIVENPDLVPVNGVYRIKPELIEERKALG